MACLTRRNFILWAGTYAAAPTIVEGDAFAQTSLATQIAPTGKLRMGINSGNAALVTKSPDRKLAGIAPELGRFLAAQINLAFEPIVYPTTADFTRSFDKGEWDIILTGTSPLAAKTFHLTPAVADVDYVFLSAPGHDFASVTDVDKPGVRIGVSENSSPEQYLKRTLTNAQLVRYAGGLKNQLDLIRSGRADLIAGNTDSLLLVTAALPGTKIVPGIFMESHVAIALPKDRSSAAQSQIADLLAAAKRTGALEAVIAKAGSKGVRIAPN